MWDSAASAFPVRSQLPFELVALSGKRYAVNREESRGVRGHIPVTPFSRLHHALRRSVAYPRLRDVNRQLMFPSAENRVSSIRAVEASAFPQCELETAE
jgi:hypothetical protein